MIVVSDTSPITNLAAIGQLDLLRQLYRAIVIPFAVNNEMTGTSKPVPGALEVQTFDWIRTQAVADAQSVTDLQMRHISIDRGEAEAIALAVELSAGLLLMDERRGRLLANSYDLKVTGLLGVILLAKHQALIPAVKPLIDQMIAKADFRVSSQLYEIVLNSAGEVSTT
ncbi:MAG: DUF3368 domain-containing protein [Cyanobacteria bacterium P01_F01_bin.86]